MRLHRILLLHAIYCLVACSAAAHAAIVGVNGGTAAPGSTLGPYTMTPFGADSQASASIVTGVASPLTGVVDFSPSLAHTTVGNGWSTWGNGYTGDVYVNVFGGQTDYSITLTLPAGTGAFYLYTQPSLFNSSFSIVAQSQGGATVTETLSGSGSPGYFGFYATGSSVLSSISITAPLAVDGLAVGEFGIALVPEPASAVLLGLGAIALALWAPRRRKPCGDASLLTGL